MKHYLKIILAISYLTVFNSCSIVDFDRMIFLPDTVFLYQANENNISVEEQQENLLPSKNRRIGILPVYSQIPEIDNQTLAAAQKLLATQLLANPESKLEYQILELEVFNSSPDALQRLKQYQEYIYEISISEKSLASQIYDLAKTPLLLNLQINNWPTKPGQALVAAQIRLIDAPTGTILWHAGDSIKIDDKKSNVSQLNLIISRFAIIFNKRFAKN